MDLTSYNEEEKILMVEEFKSREISINEFAREKGIPATTFRGWLKQEREAGFGRINLKQTESTNNSIPKKIVKPPLIFANENIRIELREGFNKELLKNIVEVLINDK